MENESGSLSKVTKLAFDLVDCAVSALVVVVILLTFFFIKFTVNGSSMLPTLHDQDKLLVYHFMYKPKRNDIVTIDKPGVLEKNIVKRVIGLPGDSIRIDYEKGQVFVNGKLLDEPYVNTPTNLEADWELPEKVPDGYYLVLGDNRNGSSDSRSSLIRLIPENKIMGKVVCIYSPFNRLGIPK